jgi:hypothetical protein
MMGIGIPDLSPRSFSAPRSTGCLCIGGFVGFTLGAAVVRLDGWMYPRMI